MPVVAGSLPAGVLTGSAKTGSEIHEAGGQASGPNGAGSVALEPAGLLDDLRRRWAEMRPRAAGCRGPGVSAAAMRTTRTVQVLEGALGDARGDLAPDASGQSIFVQQDGLGGLLHARQDRLFVDRQDRPEVDDLHRDALLGSWSAASVAVWTMAP